MERILIADDVQTTIEALRLALRRDGFEAVSVSSGAEVLRLCSAAAPENLPALVLLEPALPDKDGYEICKEIRAFSDLPVIIMSARDDVAAKVLALAFGADDYITKPFDTREVMARIKAVLRRVRVQNNQKQNQKIIEHDKLVIDMNRYEAKLNGKVCELPPKEIELLFHLASNPNRVFTRDQLLDDVWGFEYYGDSRTIDVHIKRLRTKLEGVSGKWFLKTVWGVGYKFELIE
ncbi:MAG: response regulator transcription factor [Oscillospiraceae bacterium]|jgi:DNA-binding response OmpR family regulator|nr:response regulator transcription factor [Oscillospiraceae bacterium]